MSAPDAIGAMFDAVMNAGATAGPESAPDALPGPEKGDKAGKHPGPDAPAPFSGFPGFSGQGSAANATVPGPAASALARVRGYRRTVPPAPAAASAGPAPGTPRNPRVRAVATRADLAAPDLNADAKEATRTRACAPSATPPVPADGDTPEHRCAPSWSDVAALPMPGARCYCCRGLRWWTEARNPSGWRCWTCHPPDHLAPEHVRELRT